MTPTTQRLEIPFPTYNALARIAQGRGSTPLQRIEGWIEQYQSGETRRTLRQEYQKLIEKDLARTLTADEQKRLDAVCDALNALEAQGENNAAWQGQPAAYRK